MFSFGKKLPPGLLENFAYNCQFTPDAVQLEHRQRVPLFVYNEMQTRFNSVIPHLEPEWFEQAGFTVKRIYRIWQSKMYQTPVALEEPNPVWRTGCLPGHIKGELYYVPGTKFKDLDKYMKNELEFRRVPIRIVLPRITKVGEYPNTGITTEWAASIGSAHMYVGIKEYWETIIDAEHFRLLPPKSDRRFKSYYSFDPKDIEWTTQEASSPIESRALSAEATAKIAREITSQSTTTDTGGVISVTIIRIQKENLRS